MKPKSLVTLIFGILMLVGCTTVEEQPPMTVFLVVDGREQTWQLSEPLTVAEFLRQQEVELGSLDRVVPSDFTQITDKMRITVVRVREEDQCEEVVLPYERETSRFEGLQPGEERIGQPGKNGVQRVCYRVRYEDNVPGQPLEVSRLTLVEPQSEIVYVAPTGEIEPVPIPGTLMYIGNKNAWMIRGSSTNKRPLTLTSDLDPRVFSLSPDGRQLLFARKTPGTAANVFSNQLWLISNTNSEVVMPVKLVPEDVLYVDWVPGRENTISYSAAEPREAPPGWKARNDLWVMRIDPLTGESLNLDNILEESCSGFYCWWGDNFHWSPDGEKLLWIRADGIGLVDLAAGELTTPLLQYTVYNTNGDWSWRSSVSWSPDGNLLAATVHGPPLGSEAPETSPAFDIAVSDTTGNFAATIIKSAGMWAAPKFSPYIPDTDSDFPQGYLAYLRARDIGNSIQNLAEYDLVVADRDGSNTRVIFPPAGQPGLTAREFTWSPDGRQIAFIYLGNLWVVDVESGVAHQLTLDGGASRPVWAQ
jgi:Tol biopolymer transport system component